MIASESLTILPIPEPFVHSGYLLVQIKALIVAYVYARLTLFFKKSCMFRTFRLFVATFWGEVVANIGIKIIKLEIDERTIDVLILIDLS